MEATNQPKQLPTAYVLWLTIRSQFLDKLCHENPEFFHQFKEFENIKLTELEALTANALEMSEDLSLKQVNPSPSGNEDNIKTFES